jgi:hypothetical protein
MCLLDVEHRRLDLELRLGCPDSFSTRGTDPLVL